VPETCSVRNTFQAQRAAAGPPIFHCVRREEYAAGGRAADFALLEPLILRQAEESTYAELGARMNPPKSANTVETEICRLRDKFKDRFRAEVAATVGTWAEVDEEIRAIAAVFGR
jgi:hypothetical protein